MTDCDHEYILESIANPSGAEGRGITRTAWLVCTTCGHRQARLTQRSDDEINAEIAAHSAS
jgi:hypothetical protein